MNDSMTVPAHLIDKTMRDNFIKNAKEKPWGWEWKYTMAHLMLRKGGDIGHVKKVLQLTLPWLRDHNLIRWDNYEGRYAVVA